MNRPAMSYNASNPCFTAKISRNGKVPSSNLNTDKSRSQQMQKLLTTSENYPRAVYINKCMSHDDSDDNN